MSLVIQQNIYIATYVIDNDKFKLNCWAFDLSILCDLNIFSKLMFLQLYINRAIIMIAKFLINTHICTLFTCKLYIIMYKTAYACILIYMYVAIYVYT